MQKEIDNEYQRDFPGLESSDEDDNKIILNRTEDEKCDNVE